MLIFENPLQRWTPIGAPGLLYVPKIAEMNELDSYLSIESKNYKIGSVEKSYGSSTLVRFRKNQEILGFSSYKSEVLSQKLS